MFVVTEINLKRNAHFVQKILARDRLSLPLRPSEGGQENRRQNGNDRDDDEKFNQGEPSRRAGRHSASKNGLFCAGHSLLPRRLARQWRCGRGSLVIVLRPRAPWLAKFHDGGGDHYSSVAPPPGDNTYSSL